MAWKKVLISIALISSIWGVHRNLTSTSNPGEPGKTNETPPTKETRTWEEEAEAEALCPHPTFVEKHWCPTCTDYESDLKFSEWRKTHVIRKNSIVHGQDVGFRLTEPVGLFCENTIKTQVDTCDMDTDVCTTNGYECRTIHSPTDGHLYHTNIKCEPKPPTNHFWFW